CDIGGIVGRDVIAQLPYSREQRYHRITADSQTLPYPQGVPRRLCQQLSRGYPTPQTAGDLGVDEVRNMQLLLRKHSTCLAIVQQCSDRRRSIDDYHLSARSSSKSARMVAVSTS